MSFHLLISLLLSHFISYYHN